jgi:hypothetical protein
VTCAPGLFVPYPQLCYTSPALPLPGGGAYYGTHVSLEQDMIKESVL